MDMQPVIESDQRPRVVVSTLLGHGQIGTALRCLGSLLSFSADPLSLLVHDDGTLTESDREQLAERLANPSVISRMEADEQVGSLLGSYPNALAFRRRDVMALKLFDTVLLGRGPVYRYCDSDILFLRTFAELFALPDDADAVFIKDIIHAFSLTSRQIALDKQFRPVGRLNAGLMVFRRDAFDLEQVEFILSRLNGVIEPQWAEQTCWALLAATLRTTYFDPEQVRFPTEPTAESVVALHFVRSLRNRLAAWPEPVATADQAVATVRRVPVAGCRPVNLLPRDLRRAGHKVKLALQRIGRRSRGTQ